MKGDLRTLWEQYLSRKFQNRTLLLRSSHKRVSEFPFRRIDSFTAHPLSNSYARECRMDVEFINSGGSIYSINLFDPDIYSGISLDLKKILYYKHFSAFSGFRWGRFEVQKGTGTVVFCKISLSYMLQNNIYPCDELFEED